MLTSFAVLLLSAGVGIHLDAVDLPLAEATHLSDVLGEEIEARTGYVPVLDDPLWPECTASDRCLSAIRARTGAEELLLVSLYRGPTKIRLIAERLSPSGAARKKEINLPRVQTGWADPLRVVVADLYQDLPQPTVTEMQTAVEEDNPKTYTWIALGTTAVLATVGTIFGVSSGNARAAIEQGELDKTEYEDELSRMRTHGNVANIFFAATVVGIATTSILFFVE